MVPNVPCSPAFTSLCNALLEYELAWWLALNWNTAEVWYHYCNFIITHLAHSLSDLLPLRSQLLNCELPVKKPTWQKPVGSLQPTAREQLRSSVQLPARNWILPTTNVGTKKQIPLGENWMQPQLAPWLVPSCGTPGGRSTCPSHAQILNQQKLGNNKYFFFQVARFECDLLFSNRHMTYHEKK
jgi:hypothetical protein